MLTLIYNKDLSKSLLSLSYLDFDKMLYKRIIVSYLKTNCVTLDCYCFKKLK